jgi:hypothetical protein
MTNFLKHEVVVPIDIESQEAGRFWNRVGRQQCDHVVRNDAVFHQAYARKIGLGLGGLCDLRGVELADSRERLDRPSAIRRVRVS